MVKKLKTAIDNLAIAPDGTIYVSNMADNSVEAFNPATGELRLLTGGKLAVPAGIKLGGDSLWVAGIFAFREVDVKTRRRARRLPHAGLGHGVPVRGRRCRPTGSR